NSIPKVLTILMNMEYRKQVLPVLPTLTKMDLPMYSFQGQSIARAMKHRLVDLIRPPYFIGIFTKTPFRHISLLMLLSHWDGTGEQAVSISTMYTQIMGILRHCSWQETRSSVWMKHPLLQAPRFGLVL